MTIFCNQLILLSLIIDGQSINYKGSEHKSLSSIGHWLSIPIDWLIHWLVSIVTDYQFHWLVTSCLPERLASRTGLNVKSKLTFTFSRICLVIDNEFCCNIVKIVCGSNQLSPWGSTAIWRWWDENSWSITGRSMKTEAHLWIIPELKTYRLN